MALIDKLKADFMLARKNKNDSMVNLLSPILGDIDTQSRKKGNDDAPSVIALRVIKQAIKDNRTIMDACQETTEHYSRALEENIALKKYLPVTMPEDKVQKIIEELKPTTMPQAMKYFSQNFAKGIVDMSVVKKLVLAYLKS